MAGKWRDGTGDSFVRYFGPVRAWVVREWDYRDSGPKGYTVHLTCGNVDAGTAFIPMSSLGCDWFDDKVNGRACRLAEREAKRIIRSWTTDKTDADFASGS